MDHAVPTGDRRGDVPHARALGVLLRSVIVEREPISRPRPWSAASIIATLAEPRKVSPTGRVSWPHWRERPRGLAGGQGFSPPVAAWFPHIGAEYGAPVPVVDVRRAVGSTGHRPQLLHEHPDG